MAFSISQIGKCDFFAQSARLALPKMQVGTRHWLPLPRTDTPNPLQGGNTVMIPVAAEIRSASELVIAASAR